MSLALMTVGRTADDEPTSSSATEWWSATAQYGPKPSTANRACEAPHADAWRLSPRDDRHDDALTDGPAATAGAPSATRGSRVSRRREARELPGPHSGNGDGASRQAD